jgi:hypothetical protein
MAISTGVQEGKVDMQAVMDVYKKLGPPGAPRRMLASMAGSWNTKIHEDLRNNKKKDSLPNGFSVILLLVIKGLEIELSLPLTSFVSVTLGFH